MSQPDPAARVLYITHRVPFPPDKGDRIRNYHVLRQLARRSKVWLIALADEPITPETHTQLSELCERVAIIPVRKRARWLNALKSALLGKSLTEGAFWEPAAAQTIQQWCAQTTFHSALISTSGLVPYLQLKALSTIPRYVDLVDVDSQKWFDFATSVSFPKRWLYQFEGRRLRKLECRLTSLARGIFLVSHAEAHVYEAYAGQNTITVATNGVDLEYFHPEDSVSEEPCCAFVGAMDYLPNIDAANWFAREIWPEIHRSHPWAEFWIIGRKPVKSVQELASLPGVRLIGQVPDVRPHVSRAAVVVVPLRLSRGLQNKVLEALAMKKAVIAAPPALAALTAQPGEHLLSAQSVDEWVRAVCDLLDSPERRATLGKSGRLFVEKEHDWERCLRPLVDSVLASVNHSLS